jgi:hypothetical protein
MLCPTFAIAALKQQAGEYEMSSSKPVPSAKHGLDTSQPILEASQPMMEWWTQQWLMSANPTARMQQAWLESLSEVMQQEAHFLLVLAEASHRLSEFYLTGKGDPDRANEWYQHIAREMANHQLARIKRMAELPTDFRERIWEEI